jgi:hypothetical protein
LTLYFFSKTDPIMRQLLLVIFFLFLSDQLFSQVFINEFSSSNHVGITDEDGENNDWIELFNLSSSEINLNGYHLSDDAFNLKKWTFPAISVEPDSYLLIFASGKNRTNLPLSFQTIITRGTEWKYLIPSSDIGSLWKNIVFDASGWSSGFSGFGYGDNDDATVLNNIASVFIRKEFIITNLQDIEELVLSIDYDDGFVAYINGHEIARRNLGTAGSVVSYNQFTGSSAREATMYQGGSPENILITDPGSILVNGVNVLAIEGHNSDPGSSDFSLIPILTIGLSGAGYIENTPDYIHLIGRRLHTNFKISDEGETIILSRPDSSVYDSVPPILLPADISFGRKPDGENSWLYFASPTPGTSNVSDGYSTIANDTIKFSIKGGYFPGGFELSLSSDYPSDSIFYTLDGSEPSSDDSLFTNPIHISKNTIVRARLVNYNKFPGVISSNTYITTHHALPVVCLSTNPDNLWDFSTGIYVKGPNASTDFPYFGANFWKDWERKAHMELYDINGIKQIDQDIGIKIYGAYSRGNNQKSLALFARKEYGKGLFEYQFFKDKSINKFESVVLRNAGNDWGQSHMRDGLTSTLIKDMDIDRLAFQPSVVYINGEYWGILNIREKINSNFLAENHFVNPENVNLLEFSGSVVEGSNSSYLQMVSFMNSHTLETEQNYLQIGSKIDINNYIQYQLTEIYINNKDWPGNNIKFWNTNDEGSLWRWIVFDTDFGFSIWENSAYNFNTVSFALNPAGPDWPNPPWSTLLFRRMMSNPGFRNEFVNQFADRLNTNFTSARVNATIDSIKQLFLPEINGHLVRWDLDYKNWEYNYTNIKNFAGLRPNYVRDYLRSVLSLGDKLNIKVEIDAPGTGRVKVNSVIPVSYPFTGVYFKGLPIKLTAIPAQGYKFLRWEVGKLKSGSVTIDYNMSAASTFKAVFGLAEDEDIKIVINEINYNSSPEKDTKDWIELYNAGNTSVNLKNWIISDKEYSSGFTISSDIILSPGTYIIVCRDTVAFRLYNQRIVNIAGNFKFGLSSTGDDINLFDPEGKLIDFVHYSINPPWPTDANGTGSSIELLNPLTDNNKGKNWKSSPLGGTPGTLNLNTLPTESANENPLSGCSLSCFPNPFHDYTTVRINAAVTGKYKLEVYDLTGKLINVLADQRIDPGAYYIEWNGRDNKNAMLPGGIYIIRMSGENQQCYVKVIILK